nr:HAMP domain-containing sensor histidine kinase [Sphingomonas kaistensis]
MDFARAGLGGGIGVEAESNADVARTIEQVVAELRSIAPDREIQSVVEIDVPVRADPDRLGQLVSNLLGNALTHGDPAQPVVLHAATSDGMFTLAVSNGGIAIEPATIAGLFKPFFRGSVRPSQQGLGLGLHITSEIAKAHGGRVDVTSDERLTTFTFTMPLAA